MIRKSWPSTDQVLLHQSVKFFVECPCPHICCFLQLKVDELKVSMASASTSRVIFISTIFSLPAVSKKQRTIDLGQETRFGRTRRRMVWITNGILNYVRRFEPSMQIYYFCNDTCIHYYSILLLFFASFPIVWGREGSSLVTDNVLQG